MNAFGLQDGGSHADPLDKGICCSRKMKKTDKRLPLVFRNFRGKRGLIKSYGLWNHSFRFKQQSSARSTSVLFTLAICVWPLEARVFGSTRHPTRCTGMAVACSPVGDPSNAMYPIDEADVRCRKGKLAGTDTTPTHVGYTPQIGMIFGSQGQGRPTGPLISFWKNSVPTGTHRLPNPRVTAAQRIPLHDTCHHRPRLRWTAACGGVCQTSRGDRIRY